MSKQLICHMVGDYLMQSHWMALNKGKHAVPAAAHAITYTLPFLACTRDVRRLAVIAGTHYLIDRYRLARYVTWSKNQLAPLADRTMTATGYPPGTPEGLSTGLMIAADNTLHLVVNALVLEAQP